MRSLVVVVALLAGVGAARSEQINPPRNEIGVGGFIGLATRGLDVAAAYRIFGGRTWEHVGFRFEYDIGGVGFDEGILLGRAGYMHRGAASLRLRRAWYREERGRIDGFLDLGAGRQAIHWYDGATDWRNDVSIAAGVRLEGMRYDGGFIGWGVSVLTIISPSVPKPAAERASMPIEHGGRDVAICLAFESAI